MAILLEIHYDKRLGLPGYSSHDLGVTHKTEVTDLDQIRQESERAYQILQKSVDSQIIHRGYAPDQGNNLGVTNQEEKDRHEYNVDKLISNKYLKGFVVSKNFLLLINNEIFRNQERKSLFFERISFLLHPITQCHITGDGVNE